MVLLVFFHDVDHLDVSERCVEEEGGQPLLRDIYFQLGHLLDVRSLLCFVFFMAGERALHYDGYPVVHFDVVAAAYGIFVPVAPWNELFGDWCS